jgi:EmrB/QacA subfamily drug resistance transporter
VSGTFVSVLGTTILNVPIGDIATDLRVSIPDVTLLVTAQAIAFAVFLPLGGWVGNRFGRKRVYCIALATMGVAGVLAMFARDLPTLVAVRIIQGLTSASIVPLVMTLLADLYAPEQRALALSTWAMANSLGQALGPPLGGVLAVTLGWRAVFAPGPLVAVFGCLAALRFVPNEPPQPQPLEWRGAAGLTLGALLVLVAISAISHAGIGSPFVIFTALAGTAGLVAFVIAIRRAEYPFVSPRAFRDPAFVTSCVGVVAATICFSTALLAIPLYLERGLGYATDKAGFITFALPLAMAVIAPLSSIVVRRLGAVRSIEAALTTLCLAAAATAFVVEQRLSFLALIPPMLATGAALALHYTAGAVGTTQSVAGRYGAGIGFFNLLRIGGSAIGPAVVGTVLARDANAYAATFAYAAGAAACALALVLALRLRPQPAAAT